MRHLISALLLFSASAHAGDDGGYFQGPFAYQDDQYFFVGFRGDPARKVQALLARNGQDPARGKGVSCASEICIFAASQGGVSVRPEEAPVPDPYPPQRWNFYAGAHPDPVHPTDPDRIMVDLFSSKGFLSVVFNVSGVERLTNPWVLLEGRNDSQDDRDRIEGPVYFCTNYLRVFPSDWVDETFNVVPKVGLLWVEYYHPGFTSAFSVSDGHPAATVTVGQRKLLRWVAWGQTYEFETIDKHYGVLQRTGDGFPGALPLKLHCRTN